jgi:hypothetical protein
MYVEVSHSYVEVLSFQMTSSCCICFSFLAPMPTTTSEYGVRLMHHMTSDMHLCTFFTTNTMYRVRLQLTFSNALLYVVCYKSSIRWSLLFNRFSRPFLTAFHVVTILKQASNSRLNV